MYVLTFGCMSQKPEVDTDAFHHQSLIFDFWKVGAHVLARLAGSACFCSALECQTCTACGLHVGELDPELRSFFLGSNHLTRCIISSSPKSIFKIFLQEKGERSTMKQGHSFKPAKLLGENKERFEHRRCSLRTYMLKHIFPRCSM